MIELEITQTLRRFDREDYGNVVYGVMKEGSTMLGKFELSIPYWNIKQKMPYWVIIWGFEISPEHQHKGFGRACYVALEKMILEKYHAQEIYLEYLTATASKGFWEKLGYTSTRGQQMKKRFAD